MKYGRPQRRTERYVEEIPGKDGYHRLQENGVKNWGGQHCQRWKKENVKYTNRNTPSRINCKRLLVRTKISGCQKPKVANGY